MLSSFINDTELGFVKRNVPEKNSIDEPFLSLTSRILRFISPSLSCTSIICRPSLCTSVRSVALTSPSVIPTPRRSFVSTYAAIHQRLPEKEKFLDHVFN